MYDYKILIMRSGVCRAGLSITRPAVIRACHTDYTGPNLFDKNNNVIATLEKRELVNTDDGEIELWGYYKKI